MAPSALLAGETTPPWNEIRPPRWTRWVALGSVLGGQGIRVNVISPGPIKTPGLLELAGPDSVKQQGMLDYMAMTVPLGRVGEPDEVAKAAVFLASDDASYIAGIELFVDGGQAQF